MLIPHCYLLHTHGESAQILRLTRTIRAGSPSSAIVIWHDPSGCPLDPADFADIERCWCFVSHRTSRRADFSMVQNFLDAAARIGELGITYEWLTYLSGQDYPIQPLATYESMLATTARDGFATYMDFMAGQRPVGMKRSTGKRRYYYRYHRVAERWLPLMHRLGKLNDLQTLAHLHLTYGPYLGWRQFSHPFKGGFRCYVGSQWHSLRRQCVEYVMDASRKNQVLVDYFRTTSSPEEAYVQTVLANAKTFDICNDNLRLIDFQNTRDGHPKVWRSADFKQLTHSESFFARKFDIYLDAEVLDLLDIHLQSKSATPSG